MKKIQLSIGPGDARQRAIAVLSLLADAIETNDGGIAPQDKIDALLLARDLLWAAEEPSAQNRAEAADA